MIKHLRKIMETPEGREFIWGLIKKWTSSGADAFHPDQRSTEWILGRQSLGIEIHDLIMGKDYHDLYMKMHDERNSKEKAGVDYG